jgi:hypothetical protein
LKKKEEEKDARRRQQDTFFYGEIEVNGGNRLWFPFFERVHSGIELALWRKE